MHWRDRQDWRAKTGSIVVVLRRRAGGGGAPEEEHFPATRLAAQLSSRNSPKGGGQNGGGAALCWSLPDVGTFAAKTHRWPLFAGQLLLLLLLLVLLLLLQQVHHAPLAPAGRPACVHDYFIVRAAHTITNGWRLPIGSSSPIGRLAWSVLECSWSWPLACRLEESRPPA